VSGNPYSFRVCAFFLCTYPQQKRCACGYDFSRMAQGLARWERAFAPEPRELPIVCPRPQTRFTSFSRAKRRNAPPHKPLRLPANVSTMLSTGVNKEAASIAASDRALVRQVFARFSDPRASLRHTPPVHGEVHGLPCAARECLRPANVTAAPFLTVLQARIYNEASPIAIVASAAAGGTWYVGAPIQRETHFSAAQPPAQADARVSRADGHKERPSRVGHAPPQGPQTPHAGLGRRRRTAHHAHLRQPARPAGVHACDPSGRTGETRGFHSVRVRAARGDDD